MSAHESWMQVAIEEAELARAAGEVPVGAVVVHDGKVIGRGRNRREASQDPITHAEILALSEAAQTLSSWRLIDTTLYVTLEPCPMCAGALVNARVKQVVWGCDDPKAGALKTLYTIGSDPRLNHRFESISGVLQEECAELLRGFFADLRAQPRGPHRE